jgi:hypothetical protein
LLGCGFGKALTLKKRARGVYNARALLQLVALSPPLITALAFDTAYLLLTKPI